MIFRRRISKATFAVPCLLLVLFAGSYAGISQDDASRKFTFAVIGDTGTGQKPQYHIARQMMAARERSPFDTVIMLGDNIYGGGNPKYFKPRFEEPYKDLLEADVKFYASLGNHDAARAKDHVVYPHFNMDGRRYYSFVKGDGLIEFFALDTNDLTEDQLQWLDEALGRSAAQWKVAFFHHSIYSSAKMHPPYLKLRAQLEPLFVKHGVNVVFAGHSHAYERIKPQKGVHYYTAGSGGKLMKGTLDRKSELTVVGNDQIQIFLVVRTDEKRMNIEAITAEGEIFDTSSVER
ncbi:MAG: metallophosphoesterase [Acidobacteria bacterium]|nr:metallophosphoesterase [Acidobacteriota bacterium]